MPVGAYQVCACTGDKRAACSLSKQPCLLPCGRQRQDSMPNGCRLLAVRLVTQLSTHKTQLH
jgi:hypothetical protein